MVPNVVLPSVPMLATRAATGEGEQANTGPP